MWPCRRGPSLNGRSRGSSRLSMRWLFPLLVALPAGFAGAALWDFSGLRGNPTREYLLANPEVLPEAIQVLQKREQAERIKPLRAALEQPFPGAVLGNP